MQAGTRYSLFQTVNWTRKFIIGMFIYSMIPISLCAFMEWHWLILPWQPISLIGIAVAFYLGFKNNSSYERLWEARKIWGGIVNASRTFTVMARDFANNDHTITKKTDEELKGIHQVLVHRHVAWLHALSYQLRKLTAWEHVKKSDVSFRMYMGTDKSEENFPNLKKYLSTKDYEYMMTKGNKASHLLSIQSKHLSDLKREGVLEDFRHIELASMIKELYALQGKSERIKNFPFPRQYATANFFFVSLFIILIPFAMMSVFMEYENPYMTLWAVPFSVICGWVFYMMEMIGEYSENPFEGLYNDVPITQMAIGIEIDIRQMLDETEGLPKPMEPIGDFKILY